MLRLSAIAAWAVLALGCLTLLEYAYGPIGIDHWLPRSSVGSNDGRPSPQTALGFALVGLCLALGSHPGRKLGTLSDLGAISLIALVLVLVSGYVYQMVELVGLSKANLSSPQTVFCFFLLSCVIAARRASAGGWLSFWFDGGIGSRVARLVFPLVVLTPFVAFAAVGYLDSADIFPAAYTRAVETPIIVLAALAMIAWMGRLTNKLERELRYQSLKDQLTNVLNRRGFFTVADYAMKNAIRLKTGLTLFYFDLDGLKKVNDSLGHKAGSELITRFADVLVATFRKTDVIGRIGGDEFVVLASDSSGTAEAMLARMAAIVAARAMSDPLLEISYSSGYAETSSPATVAIDDLIHQADKMMYERKQLKKAAGSTTGALAKTNRLLPSPSATG
ncbi:GGDEF domain-containing protein [Methylocella silvestris]|nr:GGDEF domain-containing protein [Methylocella silvestris]